MRCKCSQTPTKCTRIPLCSLLYPALPFIPTTPVCPPPLFSSRSCASSQQPLFRDAPSPHTLIPVLPTWPARCLNPALQTCPPAQPSRCSAGLPLHPHVRPAVSCSPSTDPFPSAQPAHMPHKMLCRPSSLSRCSAAAKAPFIPPLRAVGRSSPLLPPRAAQLCPPPSLPLHKHMPRWVPRSITTDSLLACMPCTLLPCEGGWFQLPTSDCFWWPFSVPPTVMAALHTLAATRCVHCPCLLCTIVSLFGPFSPMPLCELTSQKATTGAR